MSNPENHYTNIHTSTDPAGSARAQLAPIVSTVPTIGGAISANLDKNATTVAPGGLISIFGTNLVKVATDLSGWAGRVLPSTLNGTSVTIGGKNAAILYMGPGQINAQVPVDVPAGQQAVVVKNTVGPSSSFNVTVAATAPAIFFSPVAAVLKNADFSLVGTGKSRQGRRRHPGLLHRPGSDLRVAAHRHAGSGDDYRQYHRGGHGDHRRKTGDGGLRHRLARFRRPVSGGDHRPLRPDRQLADRADAGRSPFQLGRDPGSVR